MSKRTPEILLEDMESAMEKISRYTDGMSRETFLKDDKTIDAVVRNLEIIGEAVKNLPEDYKGWHADLPWHQIAGLRNRIVHDYAGVDLEIIWQVLQVSLPEFRGLLKRL